MKSLINMFCSACLLGCLSAAAQPVAHWALEPIENRTAADGAGAHAAAVLGQPQPVPGVTGQALAFDGKTDALVIENAGDLSFSNATFSISAWVNPYALNQGSRQSSIVMKNNYAAGQREWGLLINEENRFCLYLRQGNEWNEMASSAVVQPGRWHHVAVTVDRGGARLYVGGTPDAQKKMTPSLPVTGAPVVIGAAAGPNGKSLQQFHGALDEVKLFDRALAAAEVKSMADVAPPAPHAVPAPPVVSWQVIPDREAVGLWSLPDTIDLEPVDGVRFSSIKDYEPEVDGFHWLHGVGLMWHKGKLYASFGHNKGAENSLGEMARYRVSDDGGQTWGPIKTIAASEGNHSVSHGVFCSSGATLYAFQGAFYDRFQRTHCMGYRLNEQTDEWEPLGKMVDHGFWPMQQPEKMADGNWIMAGLRSRNGYNPGDLEGGSLNQPAVAISHGDDLTKWDLVVVPLSDGEEVRKLWGESGVIVNGNQITILSRWGGGAFYALIAESTDYGRTWTDLRPSTMPMAPSKPCAGMLSTGQRYLISNSSGNNGNARVPLTIAYSRPGKTALAEIRVIRHGPDPAALKPANRYSYPCAIEHDGMLYVGYSDAEGRRGNNNSAALAVFPVSALQ
jgi:hypothetical protein